MSVASEHFLSCPKCGSDEAIDIAVTTQVRLMSDGTDGFAAETIDCTWELESKCFCREAECRHEGVAADFDVSDRLRAFMVTATPVNAVLSEEDLKVPFKREVYARSTMDALDKFHGSTPRKNLEDFVIEVDLVPDPHKEYTVNCAVDVSCYRSFTVQARTAEEAIDLAVNLAADQTQEPDWSTEFNPRIIDIYCGDTLIEESIPTGPF